MKVLAVDVGGSHVKILATGQKQKREIVSGPRMTARQMVSRVKKLSEGWAYEVVSVGFPGPVLHNRPVAEPYNLGLGWMGFDFASAFDLPVRVVNDAAMQALGSYEGGKMLFLGLGTGLGFYDDRERHRRTDGTWSLALQERHLRRLRWQPGPRPRRQEALAQARERRSRTPGHCTGARRRRNRWRKHYSSEEAAERMSRRQQMPMPLSAASVCGTTRTGPTLAGNHFTLPDVRFGWPFLDIDARDHEVRPRRLGR